MVKDTTTNLEPQNLNYLQVAPMTFEERYKMYMRCKKEELAKMLAERDSLFTPHVEPFTVPDTPYPWTPPVTPNQPSPWTIPGTPYPPYPWITWYNDNVYANTSSTCDESIVEDGSSYGTNVSGKV